MREHTALQCGIKFETCLIFLHVISAACLAVCFQVVRSATPVQDVLTLPRVRASCSLPGVCVAAICECRPMLCTSVSKPCRGEPSHASSPPSALRRVDPRVQVKCTILELETARQDFEAKTRAAEAEARRQRAATEAREAALVSKHAAEMSHTVGHQRDELRYT